MLLPFETPGRASRRVPARADHGPRRAGRSRDDGSHPGHDRWRARRGPLRLPALPRRASAAARWPRVAGWRSAMRGRRGGARGTRGSLAAVRRSRASWPERARDGRAGRVRADWQRRCQAGADCGRAQPAGCRRRAGAAGRQRSAAQQRVRGGGTAWRSAMRSARCGLRRHGTGADWPGRSTPRLTLCLADSLAAFGRCDARDQIERYWRWFKDGDTDGQGEPGETTASADVAQGAGDVSLARPAHGGLARSEGCVGQQPAARAGRRAACRQRPGRRHRAGGRVFAHHASVTAGPRRLPSLCGDAARRAAGAAGVGRGCRTCRNPPPDASAPSRCARTSAAPARVHCGGQGQRTA